MASWLRLKNEAPLRAYSSGPLGLPAPERVSRHWLLRAYDGGVELTGGICATCGKPVPGGGHQDGCTGLVPGSEYEIPNVAAQPTASEERAGEELISAMLAVSLEEIPGYRPG